MSKQELFCKLKFKTYRENRNLPGKLLPTDKVTCSAKHYTCSVVPYPFQAMWGFSGALSQYWQLFKSPVCGGFARFVTLFLRNVGHLFSRGFVLIQAGCDQSCKDFWVHCGTLEQTQVFTSVCEIHFIVNQINTLINLGHEFKKANALILRCR